MGYRIGAWFLDGILVGLLGIIPLIGAIVTGAVSWNQQALDQVDAYSNPFDGVTAPLIKANLSLLVLWVAVYGAINAAYFVVSWVESGATPFQKILKIRVVDRSSSRNLTVSQASLRWFVLNGIGLIVSLIVLVKMVDWVAKTPAEEWLGSSTSYTGGLSAALGVQYTLLSWGSTIWSIVLLITTATNSARCGIHDRLAGSVVLSPMQYPASWLGYQLPPGSIWPAPGAYQPGPGYPPQPGPYWPAPGQSPPPPGPGYPPQPGPYWPAPGQPPPPPGPGYPLPPGSNWSAPGTYPPPVGPQGAPPTPPPDVPPAESPEDA
jgi:hypothetical protein